MKVVDLFCGCGGFSLGLERAGFEVEWACDNWDKAVAVYKANFDHPVSELDVSDVAKVVSRISEFEIDGIVGGPPCQDFSSAGKRNEGDRADLTNSFAEIVDAVRPRFFIMENVARARSSQAYFDASSRLRQSGYGLTEIVLNASLCGVPQRRKRFFSIGILGGAEQALATYFEKRMARDELTVRQYLRTEIRFDYYYRHPRNYSRRAIYSIDEPAATIRGVNRPVPAGYPGHSADATQLHPQIRSLSTQERSRIQTFPYDFKWDAAKTHLEQMIGNAVPVELAHFVGRCVLEGMTELYGSCEEPIRSYA